ncbi:MAG: hypothetical protein H6654_17165 [Ardenticatenaceae bacterium]|nr:hypothetical protein [Anaerolineales bacterium]MCB8938397.1 hypothetical protein [Ardenticatenaceae bacterium]MCB8975293.1 hypothetical protein [Ardenticatenaceae bacterium]
MDEKTSWSINLCSKSLPIAWMLILLLGTACVKSNSNNPAPTQASITIEPDQTPVAPDPILREQLWVLSAVTYRGEDMDVDALKPTYFRFNDLRRSLLVTTPCAGNDNFISKEMEFELIFQDEQNYTLNPLKMGTVKCGGLIETQSENLRVLDTSQFEIQDGILILSGTDAQIVLNPVAPIPVLSDHLWVLSAVIYRGEDMDVDALYPTYFRFDVERGYLLVTIPCEGTDTHTRGDGLGIVFQDKQRYTLTPYETITPWCGDMIEEQAEHLKVLTTSQYEIQGEKLILSGGNVQIILEKDDGNP